MKAIGEIIDLNNLRFARCENCGIRYKARDKKWCQWCIGIWRRRQKMTEAGLRRQIMQKIEPLYLEAAADDYSGNIERVLKEWKFEKSMYFYGDTGTGKTRAMYALLKRCLAGGLNCVLMEFNQICRDVRSSFDEGVSEKRYRDKYLKFDCLFIDDMGLKSRASDYEYDVFYDILDSRIGNMLPTVVSSNKPPEQLSGSFDKRIESRLQTFEAIEFTGKDRRTAYNPGS